MHAYRRERHDQKERVLSGKSSGSGSGDDDERCELRRVVFKIPDRFLKRFDRETSGIYASRSEAIRAGMLMVLDNVRMMKGINHSHSPACEDNR